MDSRKLYAKGDNWYKHVRPGSFGLIDSQKIVLKGIALKTTAGILRKGATFDGARCPSIILNKNSKFCEYYFLGILNSKLSTYYLKNVCPPKLNNYIEFSVTALTNFPIRNLNLDLEVERILYNKFIDFVKKLLHLHEEEIPDESQIEHYQNQVDAMVYELYGLTENEIKLVEEEA